MALIKCSECGKEISDQAKKCVYCGNPIYHSPKIQQTFIKKFDQYTLNRILSISIIIYAIMLIIFLNKLFLNVFDNILAIIIFILYLVGIFITQKYVGKKMTIWKRFFLLEAIMFTPILILIILSSQTTEWNYNNFKNLYSSNLEYVNLTTSISGRCKFYYDYVDSKDSSNDVNFFVGASECSWKKNGSTYTFQINDEKVGNSSFKCNDTGDKLKCYLNYSKSGGYVYLEKRD